MNRVALFAFSDSACALAVKLCGLLGLDSSCTHTTPKFAQAYGMTPHRSVCGEMGELFDSNDALIFICACGIAVRDIAPFLRNKTVDPAVLVVDDRGQFVIPILSGHIGGANRLAREVAGLLGAVPVITTATDINGRFSVDEWASRHRLKLSSMAAAKEISAHILTNEVDICCETGLPDSLPNGLKAAETGECGIYVGIRTAAPFTKTLRVIPRCVTVGIGCRRGTSRAAVRTAVEKAFWDAEIDLSAIVCVASVNLKSDEAGLLEFIDSIHADAHFYTPEELAAVAGSFSESEFVRRTVGVGNVCERAAAAEGGRLILRKTASDGVTVAAAVQDWRICFD